MTQSNYIEHYGVKGMRWGHRKDRQASGSTLRSRKLRKAAKSSSRDAESLKKAGYSEEARAVKKVSDKQMAKAKAIETKKLERRQIKAVKKQRKEDARKRTLLSDKELDAKLERLSKEKRLKELTDSEVSPGKKFVSDIMGTAGRKVAVAALTTVTAAAVANKLGGEVSPGRAATDFYKQSTKTK